MVRWSRWLGGPGGPGGSGGQGGPIDISGPCDLVGQNRPGD